MSKVKLPICKTCEREATEVYDTSYNKSFFCHYCRVRVVSEEEIQAWFDSGPIKQEFLEQWLDIIQRTENDGKKV